MIFSKNIKKYLKDKNLSLKEFSNQLNVSISTVHGWVNGIPPKSVVTLKKIADLMNCSIDELCFDQRKETELIETNLTFTLGNTSYQIFVKKIENP